MALQGGSDTVDSAGPVRPLQVRAVPRLPGLESVE